MVNEQVTSDAPVYELQLFNFIFTNCEPGSDVSLERRYSSGDDTDYSYIGILGTIDNSGRLIIPYTENSGSWNYRFTFSSTNHTRSLLVEIYSNTPPGGDS
jgi:hypothetical protein